MRAVPPGQVVVQPSANEAVVVFMRPVPTGEIYSSSLFELRSDGDRFIGILTSGTRLLYCTAPGRTRFMLVNTGGSDHFMDAELEAGKTYYATVNFGDATGRSTYVLKPVRIGDQQSPEFKTCAAQCVWVQNTEKSEAWGQRHRVEIAKRKARSLPAWEAQADRPMLNAADGQ
jgi:hypothetical protein